MKNRCFRFKDLTGFKFNKWTVIGEDIIIREKKKGRGVRWIVECECGNRNSIVSYTLTSGKSTGCRPCGLRITKGQAAFNRVFKNYQSGAKHRGIEWALTEKQFRILTSSNCYYTGLPPSTIHMTANGEYVFNGIDRLDRNKGYSIDNCVPCNSRVNEMKMGDSYERFIEMCYMIVEHHTSKLSSKENSSMKVV